MVAAGFHHIHPLEDNVVLDAIPSREKGVGQRAFGDVERGVFKNLRFFQVGWKEDQEFIAVIIEGPPVLLLKPALVLAKQTPDTGIPLWVAKTP